MTRRFANLNFARQILPAIALLGLVIAVIFIASGLPDRQLEPPQQTPPSRQLIVPPRPGRQFTLLAKPQKDTS